MVNHSGGLTAVAIKPDAIHKCLLGCHHLHWLPLAAPASDGNWVGCSSTSHDLVTQIMLMVPGGRTRISG